MLKQNEYRYDKNIIWLLWQCLMDREKSLILQRFLDEGIEFTPLEHQIVIVKIQFSWITKYNILKITQKQS